jgi:ketosteroid isomerase-like protein
MTRAPLEVAGDLGAAVAAGRPDAVTALFAPGAQVIAPDAPGLPWRGVREPAAFFGALVSTVDLDTEIERADEDREAGTATLRGFADGRVRATGRTYRTAFVLHLTVRDGLIHRYRLHEDVAAVAAAFA